MFPLPVIAVCSWYSLSHVCFASFLSHCAGSMVLVYPLHSMKVSFISRSDYFLLLLQCRNGLPMRYHRID